MRWRDWILVFGLMVLAVQMTLAMNEPAELKTEAVKVQDILQNVTAYEGEYVLIEGVIDTECPSGCWFILNDETASIYVDILPSNFVIPQKRGSNAKVYGEVTTKNGDPMIIGKIVEIDGEIYR
jgi:hypothetical protein